MRIREGFKLRRICDNDVVVAMGVEYVDYSKIISLNESAAWLWRQVENRDFDADMLASLLQQHYLVDEATAQSDATELLEQWRGLHLLA